MLDADTEKTAKELRLPEIAKMLDSDWVNMAHHLGVQEKDILTAQMKHMSQTDQALEVLCRLVETKGKEATRNRLEHALRRIGRTDIVRKCIYTIHETVEMTEERLPKNGGT